ncbi:uncharacterized protein AKAME5_002992900 [Lates japonicus]|uniref:Uncharacterized protein n=2 Tax=Lates japonicus TaxID=270547 RepID=A0AAD3MTP4_LATJO|nr:uncharacterized protein AKAME5_002992900 [Lates japonicus]
MLSRLTPAAPPISATQIWDLNPTLRSGQRTRPSPNSFRICCLTILRSTDPCSTAVHGTLPLAFKVRLNICYYHQDLHSQAAPSGPATCGFRNTAKWPSYCRASLEVLGCRATGRMGPTLQRHPFSGLVDSQRQFCLPKVAHWAARIPRPAPSQRAGLLTHLKFENRSDDRFARQDRYGPPPEFPLASPCPGIVHHLSGPIARAHAPPPRRCGRDGPVVRPEPRGAGIPPQPARAGPHFHCATGPLTPFTWAGPRPGGATRLGRTEDSPPRSTVAPGARGPRPSPRGERAQRALSPRPREAARYGRGVAVKLAAGAASHLRPEPFQADLEPVAAHHRRRKCARRGPASAGERSREGILPHRAAVPDPPS